MRRVPSLSLVGGGCWGTAVRWERGSNYSDMSALLATNQRSAAKEETWTPPQRSRNHLETTYSQSRLAGRMSSFYGSSLQSPNMPGMVQPTASGEACWTKVYIHTQTADRTGNTHIYLECLPYSYLRRHCTSQRWCTRSGSWCRCYCAHHIIISSPITSG